MHAPGDPFDYGEFVGRNIGFVTPTEQERIRDASVFVCGVGGMGGACLLSLVRAGVSRLTIADIDRFELSNLNRQVFAFLDTVGMVKTEAVHRQIRSINPELELRTLGAEWIDELDTLLVDHPIVINGMDHVPSAVELYRKARAHRATVIDAYAAPLPSVYVVSPRDPRPEERFAWPTVGKPWTEISTDDEAECFLGEVVHVLAHSSSRHHVDMELAAQVMSGERSRMSFAPMVITTGNLMCFEAMNVILGRASAADHRGYFFNPWTARTERPRSAFTAWFHERVVRFYLRRLTDGV